MTRIAVVLLIASTWATLTFAADLSDTEKQLAQFALDHEADAFSLLERVVNINSGTMNFDGVRAVGQVFREELDGLGFETEWIDGAEFSRAGHLFARHRGRGKHFLLIGHLDTVFELDSPFQSYQALDEYHAAGPGTTDMKGGDVIMVYVLRALQSVGALEGFDVTVALIGDEEKVGSPVELARAHLVAAAKEADIVVGFEDGDGDPSTAVISRRGASNWRLRVKARPAHSSLIFREDFGSGSIFEAARILHAFQAELSGEPHLTFNPGVILGGTDVDYDPETTRGSSFGKNNVIAEHTIVAGDLRALSIEQRDRAKDKMREIVDQSPPHASAEISFIDRYPPLAPLDGNRALLSRLDQASRDLGYGPIEPVNPEKAGAADVSFTSGLVDMVIDGVGLMGVGGHTVDEVADLRTLSMQVARVSVLLHRLMNE